MKLGTTRTVFANRFGGDNSNQTVFGGLTAAYGVEDLFAHLQIF